MPNRPDDLVVSVEPRNDGGASAKADRAAAAAQSDPQAVPSEAGIPSAGVNEPDWFKFAKAFYRAVMFQRATRSIHSVGRDGRTRMGVVDLFGCYAVDDIAREFAQHAGFDFDACDGPTEQEAMYMSLTGMRWVDWFSNADEIRAKAGSTHKSKVDMAVLAQAIEARRAETGTGSVHESAVRQDAPNTIQDTTHDTD